MAEYISKEAAVDAGYLSDWYISSVDDEPPVWTDAHIDELCNDFYIIPKSTPIADVQSVDRRISIKKEYPKFNQRVLVWTKDRLYKGSPIRLGCLCISLCSNETWWEIDGGEIYEDIDIVTHWQPLPKTPKGSDTDE